MTNASGGVGEVVTYTYLPQMLLDTVIGTNTYVKNTDYDAAGRVNVRDLGNSGGNPVVRVNYTYFEWTALNGQGRLLQMTSGIPSDLDSLQDLRYTYDANGNVLTIKAYLDKTGINPQTQTFTYDVSDRLSSAKAENGTFGAYSLQSYTYNASTGNMSSMAGVNYTYGDSNHKHGVTQRGSDTYGYDANGNQTSRNTGGDAYTLNYDAESRLVGVSGEEIASFYHDGDGSCINKTIGGVTTTYIGDHFEWAGSTSTMNVRTRYFYAGATRVVVRTGSSTINYLLGDHPSLPLGTGLGSTSITADYNGERYGEVRYYP